MSHHLVLSGGPQHDFATSTAALIEIATVVGFDSTVVTEPDDFFAALAAADAGRVEPWSVVTVNALRWSMTADRYADDRAEFAFTLDSRDATRIEDHVVNGGGLLALHTAAICFDADPVWHRLLGGTWHWDRSFHPPLDNVRVRVTAEGFDHAIGGDRSEFVLHDEVYCDLDVEPDVVPILSATVEGVAHPVLWARDVGAGRVVTDLLGHDVASIRHPRHHQLIAGALSWARRRESTDRESIDV